LLLVISAFQVRIHPTQTATFTAAQQELVTMEEVVQTRQQVTPPPPPRPPVPVEVPNDELIEADDLNLDASLDITEPLTTLPPPPPEEDTEEEVFEPDVFVVVEQMPELVGGLAALMNDLVYPEVARRAGLEGTVILQVIVDAQGRPTQPNVVKSVNQILDDAAVEAVLKQTFKPGLQRNRPVAVSVTIPVHFRLTSD
jgi:protein TonB